MTAINRRNFLRHSAGIGVALAAYQVRAKSLHEKLNLGFIGLGGRGNELLGLFGRLPDVRIAALCDPDQQHLSRTALNHVEAKKYSDLRQLLDDRDVDAVVIATCNHWHALAAIWACQAGKDVYVEKPLAHNHWEGQQVVHAARKYDRIVQIGTQQRSDPLQSELKQFLHDQKALGAIKYVQVCRFGPRGPIGKRATPLQPPQSLDYNLWLGPARDEPIYRDKLHYDWHWNWNTGNGEMGNWGVHVVDDALNVVLHDRVAFPKRIAAAGGRVLWNDAGQSPNVCFAYFETASVPIFFALSNLGNGSGQGELNCKGVNSGYVIHCEGGYYGGCRGSGSAHDQNGNIVRRFTGDSGAGHQRNFVDAVLAHNRGLLNAEVEIGHHSTAWCNLTDVAIRVGGPYSHNEAAAIGRPPDSWGEIIEMIERHLAVNSADFSTHLRLSPILEFDSAAEQFSGNHAAEANDLLHREYRQPFEVPAVV
jgi:hypothetical protein